MSAATLTTATLATHTSSNSFHALALEVAAFTIAMTKENPEITAVGVATQFSEQNGVAVTTPAKKPHAASTRGSSSKKDQVAEFLISKEDALDMVDSGDFTSKCLYFFTMGAHAGTVCGAPLQDSTAETAETAVCEDCAKRKRLNSLTAPTKEEKKAEKAAAAVVKKAERAVSAEKKKEEKAAEAAEKAAKKASTADAAEKAAKKKKESEKLADVAKIIESGKKAARASAEKKAAEKKAAEKKAAEELVDTPAFEDFDTDDEDARAAEIAEAEKKAARKAARKADRAAKKSA